MKITCSKNQFLYGVNTVSKAVSNKTTMDILQCILIEAYDDCIKLTANDTELGIETVIEGTIIEPGKIALEAKIFSEIIKKIPDIFRMINFWRKGEYKVNSLDLILPVLGMLYVISPIDLIPEIGIPVLGVVDDLAILSLALPKLMKEVDKFLLWEANKKGNLQNVIDAEIVE